MEEPSTHIKRDLEENVESEGPAKRLRVGERFRQFAPSEEAMGMKCFLRNTEPFIGLLKNRYSDFLVHEVDMEGNEVHLTQTNVPTEVRDSIPEPVQEEEHDLESLLGKSVYEELDSWIGSNSVGSHTLPRDEDKEHRTLVHKAIKGKYQNVDTQTEEGSVVVFFNKGKRRDRRFVSRETWPKTRGDYLSFVLYKENKDTMDSLNLIAKMAHVRVKTFTFAGTKDRRAITTQRITAFRMKAEKMAELNKRLIGIRVGNFKYVSQPLRLGDLRGNRFVITIRNVAAPNELIESAVKDLSQFGFINYFGLQRFGTSAIPTHHIGRALLQSKYEEASHLLLDPREGEPPEFNDARVYFKTTGDISGALQRFPNQLYLEKTFLQGLKQHGQNAYLNAFEMIPRNMRTLYVHSYQSYVWNHAVSRRIELYGYEKPVVGDIVLLEKRPQVESVEEEEGSEEAAIPSAEDANIRAGAAVSVLTEEDVAKGTYTIRDVVLPLPGHSVVYPSNEVGSFYKSFMAQDSLDPSDMRRKVRDFSLPGGYRKIIEFASQIQWNVIPYDNPNLPLVETDLSILESTPKPTHLAEGKHKALLLSFTLPSSVYATMCFRELFRMSTALFEHAPIPKQEE